MDINSNSEINKRKKALEISRMELKKQELEIKELQLLEEIEAIKNLLVTTQQKIDELKQS